MAGLSVGSLLLIVPAGDLAWAQAPPLYYYSVTPCRLLDTRLPGQGPALTSGVSRVVTATGASCGIPAIAGAIAVNITAVGSTDAGNLRLYPGDGAVPTTSALNFAAGQTRANNGVFALAGNGTGTLAILATVIGAGTVHVVLDVTGYFALNATCTDGDHDGFFAQAGCGTALDCNDANPAVHPGAPEVCGDGLDNDCNGVVDGGCAAAGRFVSAAIGNDANSGTAQAPFKTIARGIAAAVALGGAQAVLVAEGSYPEKVTLVEGISLVGGHQCTAQACAWARDPLLYDTAIVNQDFEGVLAPSTVSRNTRLDGFRVVGLGGAPAAAPGSAALTLMGGTPVIMGDRILGGDVTGGAVFGSNRSLGIAILAPASGAQGALIYGNDIRGGASIGSTSAILFDAAASSPGSTVPAVIATNTIRGGNGLNTDGITALASGPGTLIAGNDVLAGTAASGGAAWGITISTTATIDANRINVDQANVGGCSGTVLCGGIRSESATAIVTNNVVFGVKARMSMAVLLEEVEKPAGAVVLNANYLDGGGEGLTAFPSTSAGVELRYVGCGACGVNAILGRIRNNVLLGGQNQSRYGVYENSPAARTSHPAALENNDFTFAVAAGRTDVLYHLWNGAAATDITTVAGVNLLTTPPASANFGAAPQLDATFHLMTGSPCIDAGTSADAPTTDMDGEPRPQGAAVDVGPDERAP